MIISGGSRSNWEFFSRHLMNAKDNAQVEVAEIRGLAADNVREALREMDAIASGTRCKNSFYHANLNTRADEHLTPDQWEQAVDTLERNLHLEGHARFVVEHTKDGRTHRHVVWSRIDPDTMTAVSDSHNFRAHELTSRELEELFGHEPVASTLTRDTVTKRPARRPDNWETFRGKRSGIDPDAVKEEVTALWNISDSGAAFAAALEEKGYILCRGDKRVFVLIDPAGDEHSLTRRLDGVKAAAVRTRLADVDQDALPSVAEGRELAEAHWQAGEDAGRRDAATLSQEAPSNPPKDAWERLGDYAVGIAGDDPSGNQAPVWSAEDLRGGTSPKQGTGRSAAERMDDYAAPLEGALRAGHDIPARDGLSWFGRFQLMFSQTAEAMTDWARGQWHSFVAMVQDRRDDPRSGPDTPEPE